MSLHGDDNAAMAKAAASWQNTEKLVFFPVRVLSEKRGQLETFAI